MSDTAPPGPRPSSPPRLAPEVATDFERDEAGRALLPKNAVRLDEARAVLSGYHFSQEADTEATVRLLFYAEALLDELDRRHGGFAQ